MIISADAKISPEHDENTIVYCEYSIFKNGTLVPLVSRFNAKLFCRYELGLEWIRAKRLRSVLVDGKNL